MLNKMETREYQKLNAREVEINPTQLSPAQKAELRRQMYERMARGSAMEEAEATARDQWQGR